MSDKDIVWEAFHETIPEMKKQIEGYKEIVHTFETLLWEALGYVSIEDIRGLKLRNRILSLYEEDMTNGFDVKAHSKRPPKGD